MTDLELWGGPECTLNRVGDHYSDQTRLTGHHDRIGDLDLFAELGVKRLRYPALWERTETSPGVLDFGWLSERLARIDALGMKATLGLLHHGSGPAWTGLLDEAFAPLVAAYARAVAERFPSVDAYTPINEPLTTARFSCLYGHWHPHRRDERSMWRALLNQIDATRAAMGEIRRVNPAAKLVQTEDLGRCQSTARLTYQADFENERRWITWDLLAGRVTPDHALHGHLAGLGFADRLARIADDPCPTDVIGVNHYPTSERFLDDEIGHYSPEQVGGNGVHRYADVEAVRISQGGVCGFGPLLGETWARYRRPVAITECHNGCTREEQVRWMTEAWRGAQQARAQGCEVVAITAWSLLGAYDWASLLTRDEGRYESGVFDLRGGAPRPTALAEGLRRLTAGETPPLGQSPGWWRRDVRLTLGRIARPAQTVGPSQETCVSERAAEPSPLLITGATGTLGQAFARACRLRGLPFHLTTRRQLAIDRADSVAEAIARLQPWAVVNAAGWVRVDEAEGAEAACFEANVRGPALLAQECAKAGIPLVTFSSDLVFDGEQPHAYTEGDQPRPLNAYGRSKLAAERAVEAAGGRCLTIRTAAFFQEADPHNFAVQVLSRLAQGKRFEAADDLLVSPTYVPDLVHATLDLLIDGEAGVWHLANQGAVTWCEFARRIAAAGGHGAFGIVGRPAASFGWPAARPAQAALDSVRGRLLPPLDDAIARFAGGHARLHLPERTACPVTEVAA